MPIEQTTRSATGSRDYLRWLEGVRAICALYVVLHHIYIGTITGYIQGQGYFFLSWLVYGQLAVVAFIVVSGFSLGLKPAQSDFELQGGALVFYKRRAWRILPPYWMALLLAMAYHLLFIQENVAHAVNLRSLVVHGFLLQDILHSNSPNGAFWSIAVEAQIYILFPATLVFCRTAGTILAVILLSLATVCAHITATKIGIFRPIDHLSPQLFIAFLLGLAAAVAASREATHRHLLFASVTISAIGLISVMASHSIAWVTSAYFWIDIAFAALLAQCFVVLSGRQTFFHKVLASRVLSFIGTFSYSLYLTHLVVLHPFLVLLKSYLSGGQLLIAMYCLGLPAALTVAFVFYKVFEQPFLSIRSWTDLKAAMSKLMRVLAVRKSSKQAHVQQRSEAP